MPTARFVTREEIKAAADEGGFTVTFMAPRLPNKVAFTVKTQLVVTTTRKGERVEEVVEWKPNDCPPFRAVICGLYGDRKGFVWTNGQNMYNGLDEVIEYSPPTGPPKVLSKEHLRKLQAGRKRAREMAVAAAKMAASTAKQITADAHAQAVSHPSDGDELFKAGFYRSPCRICGKGIKRTGKKGRAPTTHTPECP